MTYEIKRINNHDEGVGGVFLIHNRPFCLTLEETWNDNRKNDSCIPEGTYEVRKYSGTKYKDVWQIYDVPNRSAILIHWGNTDNNTSGCVLAGLEFGVINGRMAILRSKEAIEKLRKALPNKFELKITNCF